MSQIQETRVTQAVILSAGKGERMMPLTKDTPKPLLSIAGKNLIEWKLEALPETVTDVVLVVGYLGDKFRDFFGNRSKGKTMHYIEQKELNGTAGALLAAKDILRERFIVMMGDDLYGKADVTRILEHPLAIGVQEVHDTEMYGEVVPDSRGNFGVIDETKHFVSHGFINTGLYTLDRRILDIPPVPIGGSSTEFGLPHTLAVLGKTAPVAIVPVATWIKITTPEDLQNAEKSVKMML